MSTVFRPGGRILARNTLLNVTGQALPVLIGVAALPFVVRGLGPERFGLLALAWIVLQSSNLFDLGLGRAVTKFAADALGRGEQEVVPGLVWTAAGVQLVLGLIGATALFALAPVLVDRALAVPAALAGEARATIQLVALGLPLVLVTTSFTGVLEAAQRFDLINAVRAPLTSANYLLPLLGLALGFTLPGIVFLLIASRLVSFACFALVAQRTLSRLRPARALPGRSVETLRVLLGFGGWIMATGATGTALAHLERVLIASLLSVGALTFYTVPYEVFSRFALLPASLAMTLFPALSYYHGRAPDGANELLGRSLKFLLVAITPPAVFVGLFAEDILSLWIGADFAAQAGTVLRLLALVFFLNAFARVAFTALQAFGRPDLKVKLDLVEVPLFVGLCWLAIPAWGIVGAALAKLAITILDIGAMFVLLGRLGGPSLNAAASRPAMRTAAASAVFAALAFLVTGQAASVTTDVVIFALLLSAYLFTFWHYGTDARDRAVLHWRSLLRRGEQVRA